MTTVFIMWQSLLQRSFMTIEGYTSYVRRFSWKPRHRTDAMDLKLLRHNVRLVLVLQLHKTGQGWASSIKRDQLKNSRLAWSLLI